MNTPNTMPGGGLTFSDHTNAHPTPEETAQMIRLYTHWNGAKTTRTWDDVRKDIADALRAERRAAFERAIEIVKQREWFVDTVQALEAEMNK